MPASGLSPQAIPPSRPARKMSKFERRADSPAESERMGRGAPRSGIVSRVSPKGAELGEEGCSALGQGERPGRRESVGRWEGDVAMLR